MKRNDACPCHSGKKYIDCCQSYHQGTPAPTALALMRSRYSAYALDLADYIMGTTHPKNPNIPQDRSDWEQGIHTFARETAFVGLDILEFIDGPETAYVTFLAHLKQGNQNTSFTERSLFHKVNGRWLYASGAKAPSHEKNN